MSQPQYLATDPKESAKLLRLATYASISVALILIVAKLIAWGLSDSVSLLATLIDSVLDALASLINLIAVRHALTPADKEHRFGHGKAEALAGLSQSMFIAGSAGFLLFEAGRRLVSPIAVQSVGISMLVMVFSIVATLIL
ncbi:MAG: cation diffusion facilitator family transporter, partial [Porticoccaceae bacterium]